MKSPQKNSDTALDLIFPIPRDLAAQSPPQRWYAEQMKQKDGARFIAGDWHLNGEARKNLDAAFTTGIDPARCYIYPAGVDSGNDDPPGFEIGFFGGTTYTMQTIDRMVENVLNSGGIAVRAMTDSEFFFVCGYAKFLLRAFLKRFHRQLAKTVTTLIPLDQLLAKLDEEILDQEAEEEDE